MVNLTRIYTRTGDDGTTRLANNQVVSKVNPRLEAYGTVDEANCAIGVARALTGIPEQVSVVLSAVQNDLFDVGADLATPDDPTSSLEPLRVDQTWIDRLEEWCDEFSEGLPALRSFILPGGTMLAAQMNVARVDVRRAERAGWRVAEHEELNVFALRYLNRLSDLLFILGRYVNAVEGVPEPLWVPAKAVR